MSEVLLPKTQGHRPPELGPPYFSILVTPAITALFTMQEGVSNSKRCHRPHLKERPDAQRRRITGWLTLLF